MSSRPPATLLDIGCGLAKESELIQKKYGTDLYLIDGDFKDNGSSRNRDIAFGDVDSFSFYSSLTDLRNSFNSRKLRYQLFDANDLNLPPVKFDLIMSLLSCGFHYPVSAYKDLILAHSHPDSIIIVDLRKDFIDQQSEYIGIDHILHDYGKHIKASITFK
ncbi:hypothetical protein SynRS9915_00508 [Synechococcus sp. RS9915]|nr:hypothetical protein SynRS9915_00508 [Synechococcus sp. RS9915]